MLWNNQEGYIRYTSALTTLKGLLGVSQFDYNTERCELAPYVTYILEYLVRKLVCLGEDSDICALIQEVKDVFDWGTDQILSGAALSLAVDVGIAPNKYCVPDREVPYNQEHFIYAWANVLTAILVRLKLQYAGCFAQEYDGECCKCGSVGQTHRDFESWRSDVYPDDEAYDRTNYYRSNGQWRTSIQAPTCTKCQRTTDSEE